MWKLENRTPFEAERTWVRDKNGAHQWIVAVKATYDLTEKGALTLAEEQLPVLLVPEYHGAYGESSLRYEADLTAMKLRTDIYMNGTAYAPKGKMLPEVVVSLQINQWRKVLRVFGYRIWDRSLMGGLVLSAPVPFESVPIAYERAYGGYDQDNADAKKHRIDFRNPVGSGMVYQDNTLIGKAAPQIEVPGEKPGKGWPAGYGAIASYWSPRIECAGTYDEEWAGKRKPLLPHDYDPAFLQCAPKDQQVDGYLKGGEIVEVVNLTRNGRLRFQLPTLHFSFQSHFGTVTREHQGKLVSVIINSEGPQLILVWQTSLPCGNDADYLDQTVIYYNEQHL